MDLDEDVDFSKLDRELEVAIEADERYQRENAAKFRAVEQRVASYEEFRDLVLASHIKPLERKDIFCDGPPAQNCWNTLAKRAGDSNGNSINSFYPSHEDKEKVANGTHTVALSGAEFNQIWKDLDERSKKYNFLKKFGRRDFVALFGVDAGGAPLGEIFCIIDTEFCSEDIELMAEILIGLRLCSRFDLGVLFLTKEEKDCMKSVVEKLYCGDQAHLSNEFKELYRVF